MLFVRNMKRKRTQLKPSLKVSSSVMFSTLAKATAAVAAVVGMVSKVNMVKSGDSEAHLVREEGTVGVVRATVVPAVDSVDKVVAVEDMEAEDKVDTGAHMVQEGVMGEVVKGLAVPAVDSVDKGVEVEDMEDKVKVVTEVVEAMNNKGASMVVNLDTEDRQDLEVGMEEVVEGSVGLEGVSRVREKGTMDVIMRGGRSTRSGVAFLQRKGQCQKEVSESLHKVSKPVYVEK